jgi:hypothetical protein
VDTRALVETFVNAFGEGRLDDALSLLHAELDVYYKNPSAVAALLEG